MRRDFERRPPFVYAAGDVVSWPNGLFGRRMRCEQWTNAAHQGAHTARNLLKERGAALPFVGSNYFCSDQYENRIQFAGSPVAEDVVVVAGALDASRFLGWYRRDGHLVGAFGMNEPRLLMKNKVLIERGLAWHEALQELSA